jgi:hypothetical protein
MIWGISWMMKPTMIFWAATSLLNDLVASGILYVTGERRPNTVAT